MFKITDEKPVVPMTKGQVALIDGDIIAYLAAGGFDHESERTVQRRVSNKIFNLLKATGAEIAEIYLTGKNNYRFSVATIKKYKGNRDHKVRPAHLQTARDYMTSEMGAIVCNGQEADDGLGIAQTKYIQAQTPSIICTSDKDLWLIPGLHYNIQTETIDTVTGLGVLNLTVKDRYSKLRGTGLAMFYAQLIMGDSTDNIPGIPKAGPVKAYNLINGCLTEQEMFNAVYDAYITFYGDDVFEYTPWNSDKPVQATALSHLVENARLLWIRTKPYEMWEAPK